MFNSWWSESCYRLLFCTKLSSEKNRMKIVFFFFFSSLSSVVHNRSDFVQRLNAKNKLLVHLNLFTISGHAQIHSEYALLSILSCKHTQTYWEDYWGLHSLEHFGIYFLIWNCLSWILFLPYALTILPF